jgi:hypothetical protein
MMDMANTADPGEPASVAFTAGLNETVLPPPPVGAEEALQRALASSEEDRRSAVAGVAAAYPTFLAAWAELASLARDDVEAYAYARVGYHRGLDALRAAGWRGSGYVRSAHPTNRGFLASLRALESAAEAIGERDEARRCAEFLAQLDPEAGRAGRGRGRGD